MSTPVEERQDTFADPPLPMALPSPPAHPPEPAPSGPPSGLSSGARPPKKRVGFTGDAPEVLHNSRASWVGPPVVHRSSPQHGSSGASSPGGTLVGTETTNPAEPATSSGRSDSQSNAPELLQSHAERLRSALQQSIYHPEPRPRPAIRRYDLPTDDLQPERTQSSEEEEQRIRKRAMAKAHNRGKELESAQRSEPSSRQNSPSPERRERPRIMLEGERVPEYDEEPQVDSENEGIELPHSRAQKASNAEAHHIVRRLTNPNPGPVSIMKGHAPSPGLRSGRTTPTEEKEYTEDYRPPPRTYRGGILGTLMKLYSQAEEDQEHLTRPTHRRYGSTISTDSDGYLYSASSTPAHSPPQSGNVTPSKDSWYSLRHRNPSTSTFGTLDGSTSGFSGLGEQVHQRMKQLGELGKPRSSDRPDAKRSRSSDALAAVRERRKDKREKKERAERQLKITVHIAETISRQKYLQKLCMALMMYGAPTHRLEEYMRMSARVLEIEAQFLYIPGSMIISFEDRETHTSEVKLVKVAQGLDLGKLRDVHEVYKLVVHDLLGVEDAVSRLKEITMRKEKFSRFTRVILFGFAAATVGPFAFGANWIDLPICFILGCIVGVLQLYLAPASDIYANVFEITAAVSTSFLARAFGSIYYKEGNLLGRPVGDPVFCFSALASSSIALILPGYIVLCAALELQSKSIVAGSVRMVYAIIYSLFLGYGILVGTAIYGSMDPNATSVTSCAKPMADIWRIIFVPGFTICLTLINQAKWKQAPVMMVISCVGYVVNYYSAKRFGGTQINNTLAALVIGVVANTYSRVGGRVENWWLDVREEVFAPNWQRFRFRYFGTRTPRESAKALEAGELPGPMPTPSSDEQTPATTPDGTPATTMTADGEAETATKAPRRVGYSLAAAAMLPAIFVQVPSGLTVSGSLVSGIASANQLTYNNGTLTNGTTVANASSLATGGGGGLNNVALGVGYSVIQVAIGITVGLFLSALLVYPLGKRRSGLFSF